MERRKQKASRILGRKSQGAFEYILLLGGILLIVVVAIIILRGSVLNQANKQVVGNVNVWQNATSATCPNVPCGEGKGCFSGNCYTNLWKNAGFESGSATVDQNLCAPPWNQYANYYGEWEFYVSDGIPPGGCMAVSSTSYSGSKSLKLGPYYSAFGQYEANMPASGSGTYAVSFWYKTATATSQNIQLDNKIGCYTCEFGNYYSWQANLKNDGQWHYAEIQFAIDQAMLNRDGSAGSPDNNMFFLSRDYGDNNIVYFDDVALVKIS